MTWWNWKVARPYFAIVALGLLIEFLVMFLCGCGGARRPVETRMVRINGGTRYVAYPVIGAPPVWQNGQWVCTNTHYEYTNLRCELKHER
jgi:hypothetical protein